ncbi:H-NS family nucleoid-associated regulatory protein [Burkholderia diffusa]|uniref:H-NS family nucleoid-associated regulatory protein n=1 Tax=Burkholderia diffusa TaxID=488732 RepID=UPI0015821C9A
MRATWIGHLRNGRASVARRRGHRPVAAESRSVRLACGSARRIRASVAQPDRNPDIYGIYRDPVTGQTWDGSGRLPKWLKGKQRGSYLVIG